MTNVYKELKRKGKGEISGKEFNDWAKENKFDDLPDERELDL